LSLGLILISKVVREKDIAMLTSINTKLLWEEELKVFEPIRDYFNRYRVIPDEEFLRTEYRIVLAQEAICTQPTDYYIEKLRDRFARDAIANLLERKDTLLTKSCSDMADLIFGVYSELTTLSDKNYYSNMADNLAKSEHRIYENMHGGAKGIPLGFGEVDEMLLGLRKTDLFTLSAPSGEGKSWMILHCLLTAQNAGYKTMYINMEMDDDESSDRMLAMLTHINADYIMTGEINPKGLAAIKEAVEKAREKPAMIFVDGNLSYSVNDLLAAIYFYKPDVIFIDGVYLMNDGTQSWNGSMYEKQREVINKLKQVNKKYKIPIVMSTQNVSAKAQKKEASKANISGGADIINASSVVVEVRTYESDPNFYEMTIVKVRRNAPEEKRKWLMRKDMNIHKFDFAGFITDNGNMVNRFIHEEINLEELM
jgi:KaiC/GvpD/RAD55 family RecA-like ATPase